MIIDANTKIAKLIKGHPDALDAIVSITPKFEKLRNPLLRKLMAGRTTIAMAAKISGCGVEAFYEKLKPLGFEVDESAEADEDRPHVVPAHLHQIATENIRTLDVRPILAAGKDPLKDIMQAVKNVPANGALKVVNTFEPTPLIRLLEKQGFQYFVDNEDDDTVETWFFKKDEQPGGVTIDVGEVSAEKFEDKLSEFVGRLIEIDVRHLQMPQPMHTILETLETLPEEKALYVNHKRIPVFLLPELRDRGFDFRIKEISDSEVKLLIFRSDV